MYYHFHDPEPQNQQIMALRWRVTEMSDILLILLDSRCPCLHLPPSLATYLSLPTAENDTAPRSAHLQRAILVLTKVDISGPARVSAWTSYLETRYPGTPIVPVEAYVPIATGTDAQGRVKYTPQMAGTFRERLVRTLKEVHAKMLQPPEWVDTEEKLRRWRPKVRKNIDWERVMNAKGTLVGKVVGGPTEPSGNAHQEPIELDGVSDAEGALKSSEEPGFLTIGLIGRYVRLQLLNLH